MNPITSTIREQACERFDQKKAEVESEVRSAKEIASKEKTKLKSAKKEVKDTLSEVEKRLEKTESAAKQASSLSLGGLKEFATSQAKAAQEAVSEKVSSVSQSIKDGAVQERAESAARSLETSALATVERALAPKLAGIQSDIKEEVAAVTALTDLYIGNPDQVFLVMLDYLLKRLMRDLQEMRETLFTLDTMAQDVIEAILFAKEAEQLLSDDKRQPHVFKTAAEHTKQAAEELEFRTAYTPNQDADEFQQSSFVQRAIDQIDKAREILPRTQTLPEKAQEAYNLLDNAASRLRNVGEESVTYLRRIRTLAESYGDALMMAFLIRNLPDNMAKGFQLAGLVGSKDILSDIIEGLEERADAMREFGESQHRESKINRRAIYERAKLQYYQTQLSGMEGLLSGSISDSYNEAIEEVRELVEDPFFFGCGDRLVEVETYGRYVTGISTLPGSRYDAMTSAARKMRGAIDGAIEKISGLINEARERRPTDPSLETFRLLMRKLGPKLDIESPMLKIATGTFAKNVAQDNIGTIGGGGERSTSSESESSGGSSASSRRDPFSDGRPYFSDDGGGRSQAELASEKESQKLEKKQKEKGIEEVISEAAEVDKQVKKSKRSRLSSFNY